MSNVPPPVVAAPVYVPASAPRRHAWGLPAGSIRALLALAVLGLLWAVALYHPHGETVSEADKQLPMIMISLQILMVLILVHFFTAHGKTIGRHISGASPLGMPGGSIRFVLAVGYIGLCGFLFYNHADFSLPANTSLYSLLLVLVVTLSGYFAGLLISGFVRMAWGDPPPGPYLDLEAWVAMLAMLGLGVIVLLHLVNRSVSDQYQIQLDTTEAVVSGLIGLYFGARS
jgi:hypothetical protein